MVNLFMYENEKNTLSTQLSYNYRLVNFFKFHYERRTHRVVNLYERCYNYRYVLFIYYLKPVNKILKYIGAQRYFVSRYL